MTATDLVAAPLPSSVFRASDIARAAFGGLVANRLRAVLSALGIAIGIASMVAVLGIASSSRAELIATLDRLGTNLLAVTPGTSFLGDDVELPATSTAMVERIGPVQATSSLTAVDASVFRSELIAQARTGGLAVLAADGDLTDVLGAALAAGRSLSSSPVDLPVTVLGATAAERLGITRAGVQVVIGGERFGVIGILDPVELVPVLDSAALIPRGVAQDLFGTSSSPSTLYVRTTPEQVDMVSAVLAATANPENAEAVEVSRPSDALAARDATEETFTTLLLGLGAVALVVGGLGIANVMVIAVLERRTEIGLRRALGATRRFVSRQFLGEAVLLSGIGGFGGGLLGIGVVAGYAASRDLPLAIDAWVPVAGIGAAVLIGAIAGVYPALRAARMSPTEALNH
ncbi:MAG: putative ABC transport system permease protein [Glaciecola sp.]|jgi:putative ABC transport system permease protein